MQIEKLNQIKLYLMYVCVTRVFYFYNDANSFLNECKYLKNWKNQPQKLKDIQADLYAKRREKFNECLNFKHEIIERIAGRHIVEENGVKKIKRYTIEEIEKSLCGFLENTTKNGTIFSKKNGKFTTRIHFSKKYFIKTSKWKEFLSDDKYKFLRDLKSIPLKSEYKKMIYDLYYKERAIPQIEHPEDDIHETTAICPKGCMDTEQLQFCVDKCVLTFDEAITLKKKCDWISEITNTHKNGVSSQDLNYPVRLEVLKSLKTHSNLYSIDERLEKLFDKNIKSCLAILKMRKSA